MATLAPIARLRGRTVELRTLADALGRAAGGRPAIVVVEGEAGIGKSRRLAEALDAAHSRGLQVAAGRGQELERNRPFGLLADAFGCSRSSPDPRRAAVAALLAAHDGGHGVTTVSSDPGLQFQAVDAFLDLVEALARRGPLVLGLDDLQWADPSSLLTLGALARRLTDSPLALLVSLRLLPRGPELERTLEALDAAGARRLPLGQLDQEAVTELVAEAVAAEAGPRLMAEVAAAGGNPLFVTELVAALLSEGAAGRAGRRPHVVGAAGRGRGRLPLAAGRPARPVGAGPGSYPALAHLGHPRTDPRGPPGAVCVQQSPGLAGKPRAAAWAAESMARLDLGDLDGAAAVAERARCAADLPDDDPAVSLATASLALVEELRANPGRGLELADEAVHLADRSDQRRGYRNPVHLARGCILMICLHFLVGVVLIVGFMRALTRPSYPADQAAGYRPSRG